MEVVNKQKLFYEMALREVNVRYKNQDYISDEKDTYNLYLTDETKIKVLNILMESNNISELLGRYFDLPTTSELCAKVFSNIKNNFLRYFICSYLINNGELSFLLEQSDKNIDFVWYEFLDKLNYYEETLESIFLIEATMHNQVEPTSKVISLLESFGLTIETVKRIIDEKKVEVAYILANSLYYDENRLNYISEIEKYDALIFSKSGSFDKSLGVKKGDFSE